MADTNKPLNDEVIDMDEEIAKKLDESEDETKDKTEDDKVSEREPTVDNEEI